MNINLSSEIANVQAKIDSLKFQLTVEQKVLERLKRLSMAASGDKGGKPKQSARSGSGESLTSYIVAVLEDAGKALFIDDIVKQVEERGASTASDAGIKPSIASALSRGKDVFVRVDKGVYDLRKRHNISGANMIGL